MSATFDSSHIYLPCVREKTSCVHSFLPSKYATWTKCVHGPVARAHIAGYLTCKSISQAPHFSQLARNIGKKWWRAVQPRYDTTKNYCDRGFKLRSPKNRGVTFQEVIIKLISSGALVNSWLIVIKYKHRHTTHSTIEGSRRAVSQGVSAGRKAIFRAPASI